MLPEVTYSKILQDFIDGMTENGDINSTPSVKIAGLFETVLGCPEDVLELAIYLYNNPNLANDLQCSHYIPYAKVPEGTDSVLDAAAEYLALQRADVPAVLCAHDIAKPDFTGYVLAIPIIAYTLINGYVLVVFRENNTVYPADSPEVEFLVRAMKLAALVYQKNMNDEMTDHNLVTDYLTDLPNREQIYEMIIYSLQMSEIYATRFVLFIARINGLKNINNSLGIFTGDAALKQIGAEVREAVLAAAADNEPFVGRLTGSDFAIIINLGTLREGEHEGLYDASEVIKTCCEAIITKIKNFIEVYGYKLYLSVNIGASIYPNHGATAEELIRKADLAKGISKNNKPNSYEIYKNEMDGDAEKIMFLSNNLPDAIAKNQFELFYQAQVDVNMGIIGNSEALIRWNHPEKGMIFPGYFIPYAEDNGYGIELDILVLDMVCDQINRWTEKGINMSVSVNISPKHFPDELICDTIRDVIEKKGINPVLLKIELLESTLVANFDVTVSAINKLRAMGIAVALDDFGTGYSSLEYVSKLPLDYLKIDREFSMNLEKNPNNKILMETIMTLAKGMKVKTIVEGVEDIYQYNYLKSIGADFAQGYFINKPMPSDAFEEFIGRSGKHKEEFIKS